MTHALGEHFRDLAGYAHHRKVTPDPLSFDAVRLWKKWLSECKSCHSNCSSIKTPSLPTRVIDVGPSDGSVAPRLHQSMNDFGEWATLSHCWGKSVLKMLTSTSFDSFMQSIPITTLSKNFQDAIKITRILGIRYLWIDSLCIIQDSTEDWLRESARIGEIYKYSILTIAATNAGDGMTGFLRKRPAEVHCQLQAGEQMMPVYIRPRIDWYCFPEVVGPLTRRAWVLQERLLSQRILHFGDQQTMWQCRSKTLAEGFSDLDQVPTGQTPEENECMLRNEFHAIAQPEMLIQEKSQGLLVHDASEVQNGLSHLRDSIYDLWYHVIGIYGCLNLTKITDKLPAIAGIARQVQLRTGDVYLSGLWKFDIERGLQWFYQPASVLTKPSNPRAPSWSWASPDVKAGASVELFAGTVNLSFPEASRHRLYEHSVRLLTFSNDFALNNCLGNAAGSITLFGLWIDAKFSHGHESSQDPDAHKFRLSYPTPLLLRGYSTICAAGRLDFDEHEIDTTTIGCLQVGKFEYSGRNYRREEYISTLLLERICDGDGNQSCQYVRVGLGVLFKSCDPLHGWEKREIEIVWYWLNRRNRSRMVSALCAHTRSETTSIFASLAAFSEQL